MWTKGTGQPNLPRSALAGLMHAIEDEGPWATSKVQQNWLPPRLRRPRPASRTTFTLSAAPCSLARGERVGMVEWQQLTGPAL